MNKLSLQKTWELSTVGKLVIDNDMTPMRIAASTDEKLHLEVGIDMLSQADLQPLLLFLQHTQGVGHEGLPFRLLQQRPSRHRRC